MAIRDGLDGDAAFKRVPTNLRGRGPFEKLLPQQNGLEMRAAVRDSPW